MNSQLVVTHNRKYIKIAIISVAHLCYVIKTLQLNRSNKVVFTANGQLKENNAGSIFILKFQNYSTDY